MRVDVRRRVPLGPLIPSASGRERVDMGVPSQVRGRGVDGHDHAGANTLSGGFGDQLAHRPPCCTTELAEQLAAMKEVGSQELRNGEGPEAVPHLLHDLVAQQDAEHRPQLGRARRAESSTRTGEGQRVLGPAGVTEDAGEDALEIAAAKGMQRQTAAFPGTWLPEGQRCWRETVSSHWLALATVLSSTSTFRALAHGGPS